MGNVSVRDHAMKSLVAYINMNPKLRDDLKLVIPDEADIQSFSKWQKVRNNYKDMNLTEYNYRKGNTSIRSTHSSFMSMATEKGSRSHSPEMRKKNKSSNSVAGFVNFGLTKAPTEPEIAKSSPLDKSELARVEMRQSQDLNGFRSIMQRVDGVTENFK